MRLEFAGKCDIGKKREMNQDAMGMYHTADAGLFVVADGMGGHTNGDKASRMVVTELQNWWKSFSPVLFEFEFRRMLMSIEQVVEYANGKIFREFNQRGICGTTVIVLFLYRNYYGVIYAGDSRCYLGQGWKWKQLTVDEVWENQPFLSHRERMMKDHPHRGKLVNAIGIGEEVKCRVMTDQIPADALFLLCSDGLYKFCPDKVMKNIVKKDKNRKDLEQSVDRLIDVVYQNGADDNISVILVKCSE